MDTRLARTPMVVSQKLFQINAKLARDLLGIWAEEVRGYVEANVSLVRKLSETRSPADLISLQREYSELFAAGVREALERRVGLMREAIEAAGGVMRGTFGETQQELYDAAAEVVADAEEIADAVKDELEDAVDEKLTLINGVGPKLAEQLRAHGVISLQQIAALDLKQVGKDAHPLHALHGRMEADGWIDQARALISAPRG